MARAELCHHCLQLRGPRPYTKSFFSAELQLNSSIFESRRGRSFVGSATNGSDGLHRMDTFSGFCDKRLEVELEKNNLV